MLVIKLEKVVKMLLVHVGGIMSLNISLKQMKFICFIIHLLFKSYKINYRH